MIRESSIPQALAEATRRRSSCMRSSVRATSMPPLAVKTPSSSYCRTASSVELRHLLRVVDREDEVRGVAGRAAGVRERALVEQDEVAPAELGEVVGEAVADDARRRSRLRAQWSAAWRSQSYADISRSRGARHASPASKCSTCVAHELRRLARPSRAGSPRAARGARARRPAASRRVEREHPDAQRERVVLARASPRGTGCGCSGRSCGGSARRGRSARGRRAARGSRSSSSRALSSSRSACVARSAASRAASGSSTARTSHSRARSRTSTVVTNMPAARVDLDEPLLREPAERLAHRRPADAELRRQRRLADRRARRQLERDDQLADREVRLVRERDAPHRRRAGGASGTALATEIY